MQAQRLWVSALTSDLLKLHSRQITHTRVATQEAIEVGSRRINLHAHGRFPNHDQIRHATKMGLNPAVNRRSWMLSNGTSHPLDADSGTKNALAATVYILGLPGSTYMYQGEELGLHEVTDIPESEIQDPQYLRNLKVDKGRDGCRVPLPWTSSGSSFGFGSGGAHLPQPKWFADYAVEVEEKQEELSALYLSQGASIFVRKLVD